MICNYCGSIKGKQVKNGRDYYYCGECNRRHQRERALRERNMLNTHPCKCKGKLYETAKVFNADRKHDFLVSRTEAFVNYQIGVGAICLS